ncbi:leucine-zipper-like transcriptional regulator 1 [Anaeramoeba ignava]|uniref:Leucine-zipper-like transcriptional regulator 1 n=1 Tax=Anaeramoeba ignava TaxID=1746090 RepID=A0A9Q0L7W5_ANAIG|nr:leucine-zipper-like transcriptional regulator 1 [Anaeramoeba ignava]
MNQKVKIKKIETDLISQPEKRSNHSMIVIGTTLFLFGGRSSDHRLNSLHRLNFGSNQWEFIVPQTRIIPKNRSAHSMNVYENKIYILGGICENSTKCGTSFFVFDPIMNCYQKLPDSPVEFVDHSAVVYKDFLIVVGDYWKDHPRFSNDLVYFNFKTNQWNKITTSGFAPKSSSNSAVIFQEKLYVFGGLISSNSMEIENEIENENEMETDSLFILDLKTQRWEKFSPRSAQIWPHSRFGHSCFVRKSKMIITSGFSIERDLFFGDLFEFDFFSKTWKEIEIVEPKPSARLRQATVYLPGKDITILFGGFDETQYLNDLYCFSFQESELESDMRKLLESELLQDVVFDSLENLKIGAHKGILKARLPNQISLEKLRKIFSTFPFRILENMMRFIYFGFFDPSNLSMEEMEQLIELSEKLGINIIEDSSEYNPDKLGKDLKKIFLDEESANFRIEIKGKYLPVHKEILYARTTLYQGLFEFSTKDSSDIAPDLSGYDLETVKCLLMFLYSGEASQISFDQCLELLTASDYYGLNSKDQLHNFCIDEIIRNANENNIRRILKVAERNECEKLIDFCENFSKKD